MAQNNPVRVQQACEQTPAGWWVGLDDEFMNIGGPFETREEAIQAGEAAQQGGQFYICFAAVKPWGAPDAAHVIDAWIEDNEEIFYEDGFDGFTGPDAAEYGQAMEADLQGVLNAWFDRHKARLPNGTAFDGTRDGAWFNVPAAIDASGSEGNAA